MYNLTVANTHNYFVGGDGVLVHNAKDCWDRGNKVVRKKPDSLGKSKGRDALKRENKIPNDAANKVGLDKDQRDKLHQEISGKGYSYHDIVEIAQDIKDGKI